MIVDNSFGVLLSNDIKILGAMKVDFMQNRIDHGVRESITFENAKSLSVKNNFVGVAMSQPIVDIIYDKDINNCNDDDLRFSDITRLEIAGNHMPSTKYV